MSLCSADRRRWSSLRNFSNGRCRTPRCPASWPASCWPGARTDSARRLVERELLGAFERRGRIVAPSAVAWAKTGLVLGRATTVAIGASWQNDLLLAHTAREFGWTLITRDKDFARIRSFVKGLKIEAPFPHRPTIARGAV